MAIEPHLPKNQPGARRVDDRRLISGVLHVLSGLPLVRFSDRLCSVDDGLQLFNRWSHRGFWLKLPDALVDAGAVTQSTAIDTTYVKAAAGGVRGKRGRLAQAIGRSRGGWTTKVYALTDVIGRLR
jgi:hypothetical protein